MSAKRWWLVIALVLSVAINVGLLVAPRVDRGADRAPATDRTISTGDEAIDPAEVPEPIRRIIERMCDELRLDGERRERFAEIQRRFFRDTHEGRERVRRAQAALRAELLSATPERAATEDLLGEFALAQVDLERAFVESFFASIELLDAEQAVRYRRILGHLRNLREARETRGAERPRAPWRRERPKPPG